MDREQIEGWAREAGMDDAVVSNYHGQFRMVNAKSLEHFARRAIVRAAAAIGKETTNG